LIPPDLFAHDFNVLKQYHIQQELLHLFESDHSTAETLLSSPLKRYSGRIVYPYSTRTPSLVRIRPLHC
uniref:Pecanex-like protein n=1 Tax=Haemonchus placei TaxID=6290 RepID=A0A0N4WJ66_HAEPC